MSQSSQALTRIDAACLRQALAAGIAHVLERRELLNRINVFPVPDGDTGTNLGFTLRAVHQAIQQPEDLDLPGLLDLAADAALDGARGNSGAIIAQYIQGAREAIRSTEPLAAEGLARMLESAAHSAWSALAEPVDGGLPTVLQAFAGAMQEQAELGESDIRQQYQQALNAARQALSRTQDQLPALRQAGVVDAGGQGFIDLLDGIWSFMETGEAPQLPSARQVPVAELAQTDTASEFRFCTECIIEASAGESLDSTAVQAALATLEADSVVVAGSARKLRVHLHTDRPADAFLACEAFGTLASQKADDMHGQQRLMDLPGEVAVVTDSGADIPPSEQERLHIQIVPVRVNFGDDEYMDRVSLSADEFYDLLQSRPEKPQTSQPPPGDFRRQYELLTGHGYQVVSVNLSRQLSGTLQAAESAAARSDGQVQIVDTLNASAGQALLVIAAAEKAQAGASADEVIAEVEALRPETRSYGFIDDLSWGVRGGRVPAWAASTAQFLRILPVMVNSDQGEMKAGGAIFGRSRRVEKITRFLDKRMRTDRVYRVLIAHCQASERAVALRRGLLQAHPLVHSCLVTEAGPAVGVHLGPGGMIVGVQPVRDATD